MKLTQTLATVFGGIFTAWSAIATSGGLPDKPWVHTVTTGMFGVQTILTAMGFNRTPNGTKIPEAVKDHVDATAAATAAGTSTTRGI